MKILIAVPTYETIYPDTYQSIWDMDKCGHECIFEYVRGYDVASARSMICARALELECDYVFMVDNDVILPKETLQYLTEDIKPVQLGIYAHREKTGKPFDGRSIVFKADEESWKHNYSIEELDELREQGKYKVVIHGGGMGCALISTEVLKQMRFPYFYWVHFENNTKKQLSEDLYFCDQCKSRDIPIYTDTRVRCGHIFRYIQNC